MPNRRFKNDKPYPIYFTGHAGGSRKLASGESFIDPENEEYYVKQCWDMGMSWVWDSPVPKEAEKNIKNRISLQKSIEEDSEQEEVDTEDSREEDIESSDESSDIEEEEVEEDESPPQPTSSFRKDLEELSRPELAMAAVKAGLLQKKDAQRMSKKQIRKIIEDGR